MQDLGQRPVALKPIPASLVQPLPTLQGWPASDLLLTTPLHCKTERIAPHLSAGLHTELAQMVRERWRSALAGCFHTAYVPDRRLGQLLKQWGGDEPLDFSEQDRSVDGCLCQLWNATQRLETDPSTAATPALHCEHPCRHCLLAQCHSAWLT